MTILPAALSQLVSISPVDIQNIAYALYDLIAATSGDVTGPASAVNNRIASFDGVTGKLIKDSGVLSTNVVQGPGSATDGDVAVYDGATGKLLKDTSKVAANLVTGPGSATDGNLAVFDGATGKIIKDGGAPSSGLAQASTVSLSGGNVSTSSATFVDLTGASITITTGAHRCLIMFTADAFNNNAAFQTIGFTIDIDGVNQGGTVGLIAIASALSNPQNVSFQFLTAPLSAASHTFKIRWLTSGGTATVNANASVPLNFAVIETNLTT